MKYKYEKDEYGYNSLVVSCGEDNYLDYHRVAVDEKHIRITDNIYEDYIYDGGFAHIDIESWETIKDFIDKQIELNKKGD